MIIAQANIARFRWPLSDDRMKQFASRVSLVNELAEQSIGFVWRFTGEYVPREIGAPWNDPLLFFNMSAWRDFDSLNRFVNVNAHREVMRERQRWTFPVSCPSLAMWWIGDQCRPSVDDAILAISSIAEMGDTIRAFSGYSSYTHLEKWLEARDHAFANVTAEMGEPSDAPESASRGVSTMEGQPRRPGDR